MENNEDKIGVTLKKKQNTTCKKSTKTMIIIRKLKNEREKQYIRYTRYFTSVMKNIVIVFRSSTSSVYIIYKK